MYDQNITKTAVRNWGEYFEKQIYGLNIFRSNKIARPLEVDPQLEFLRRICDQNHVSANLGNLYDYADSHEELFDHTAYSAKYSVVRTGCYGGEFYDSKEWNTFAPLFFSSITSDFVDLAIRDESLIRRVLQLDAIALFTLRDAKDSAGLLDLMNEPIVTTENLLVKATDLSKLVLTSQADGDYFSCFSKNEGHFETVNEPLDAAVSLIRQSQWYQENATALAWDDEYSMCLVKK